MNKKLNLFLIIIGAIILILNFILAISKVFVSGPKTASLLLLIYVIGVGFIIFGGLNFSKLPTWAKWVITVPGAIIITYILILIGVLVSLTMGVY